MDLRWRTVRGPAVMASPLVRGGIGPKTLQQVDLQVSGLRHGRDPRVIRPLTAAGHQTEAAARRAGVTNKIGHVSTGGGASLELLAGKQLPGVVALERKV